MKYELTVARVILRGPMHAMLVVIPWEDFCHELGPPTYSQQIAKVQYTPIVVSRSADGKWHCEENWRPAWEELTANTPPEKLGWHTMQVEGSESPHDEMKRFREAGF